jgi:hypothetical protein
MSAKGAPRGHLSCVQKLRSFIGSINPAEERNHSSHGFGATKLDLGHHIFSGKGRFLTFVESGELARSITPHVLQTSFLQQFLRL